VTVEAPKNPNLASSSSERGFIQRGRELMECIKPPQFAGEGVRDDEGSFLGMADLEGGDAFLGSRNSSHTVV
jgi:hypothetical protein